MPLLMADSEKKKKTAESPKESSRRKRENRLKNQLKKKSESMAIRKGKWPRCNLRIGDINIKMLNIWEHF